MMKHQTTKQWTRSDTIALALESCTTCLGKGIIVGSRGGFTPCSCALRGIFRTCYQRFRCCATKERYITQSKLQTTPHPERTPGIWAHKDEEYVADFYLVSRRTLEPEEWDVFRFHYLLGADWRLCSARLGMDRGTFYHTIYRIEEKLGRTFRDLQPYPLYPLQSYFSEPMIGELEVMPVSKKTVLHGRDVKAKKVVPIRPPLRNAPVREEPVRKVA